MSCYVPSTTYRQLFAQTVRGFDLATRKAHAWSGGFFDLILVLQHDGKIRPRQNVVFDLV